jgi:alpha 1,2-mannosyltransferase
VDATLKERLMAWERAPGGRGPGVHPSLVDGAPTEEIELGGFNVWSSETCGSNIEPQLNTHMIKKSANIWGSMNRSTIHDTRMRLIAHMRQHADETVYRVPPELKHVGGGRGIVMVAGNADTLRRVIWSVRFMRDRGSTLPVEVYHFPEERLAEDDPQRKELEELAVKLVEAKGEKKDQGKNKSYHLKAIAIIQCECESCGATKRPMLIDPSYSTVARGSLPRLRFDPGSGP